MVDVRVLGTLTISVHGRVVPLPADARARELAAWLALHPGVHPRSRVAGVLRPDVGEEHARKTLRDAVYELRRALPEDARGVFASTRDTVGLVDGEVRVDVREFRRLVSSDHLEEAVALADGTLLQGLDADWIMEAREHHRTELAACLTALARRAEEGGDPDAALRFTRRRIALEPLSEAAHREQIRLLALAGDRSGALAAFDALADRLRRDLRVAPAVETRALVDEIRRGAGGTRRPSADVNVPLPGPLDRTARAVGRDAALRRLEAAWADAASGALRVVVVTGEPGIGKTTLVGELARRVHGHGAAVLYGRSEEEQLLPYQPFVEAVERLLASAAPADRARRLAERDGALARLLPGEPPATGRDDGDTARYLLFEAVRALLEEQAATRPLLLVLDDLHWADDGTLRLLRHLVRSAARSSILVALCVRGGELDAARAEGLAELRREAPQVDVPLTGLDAAAIEALLEGRGAAGGPELAARLQARTGGNPFFLDEVLRDVEERSSAGPPAGVREVVRRRVTRLGADAGAMLELAAVIGPEFDVALLSAASGLDAEAVLARLDGPAGAGLIVAAGGPGRSAFAHALVAETLLVGMPPSRRARLHRDVADALEARGGDRARHAGEVVRHLRGAGPLVEPARAVAAEIAAARQAERALAHGEAARHLDAAVDRLRAGTDDTDLPAILAWAGDAHARAGHTERARELFDELAALARDRGDPDLLARAAIGLGGLGVVVAAPDAAVIALLEEALTQLGRDRPGLRARLRARLAVELYYADRARARALSAEAVADARAAGDPGTLAAAFNARRVVLWDPWHAEERLRAADEMTLVARAARDDEATLQARNWRVVDLLELGRAREATAEIDAYAQLADRVGLPHYRWYASLWRGGLALAGGRWTEAATARSAARLLGQRAQDRNAAMFVRMQEEHALELQRRWADIDREWIARMMEASPVPTGWESWLALIEAHLGLGEAATARLGRLVADDCAAVPDDVNWHVACDLAEAAAELGDQAAAAALHARLAPHAGLFPVVARAVLLYGSAEYHLGRLAAVLGRHEEAVARLRRAAVENERIGADLLAVRARAALGRALSVAGEPDEARDVLLSAAGRPAAGAAPALTAEIEAQLASLRR